MTEPHHFRASSRDTQRRVCFLLALGAALWAAVLAGSVLALYQPFNALINHSAISV